MGTRRTYREYLYPKVEERGRYNHILGPTPEAAARAKEIYDEMRRDNLSLTQVGLRHNISRQRVHQILTRNGFLLRKQSRWS